MFLMQAALVFAFAASAVAQQELLPTPSFPQSPTSTAQCEMVSRQYGDIAGQFKARHEACLETQACKSSKANHRGTCSCSACQNIHTVMDRYASGDIARHREAGERQCRQSVTAREEAERRQRESAAQAQREAQLQAQRLQERERDLARQNQEAKARQEREDRAAEERRRAELSRAERELEAGIRDRNRFLRDEEARRAQEVALAPAVPPPSQATRLQEYENQLAREKQEARARKEREDRAAEERRREDLSRAEREREDSIRERNRFLQEEAARRARDAANAPRTPAPRPSRVESLRSDYNDLMDRDVRVGGTQLNAGSMKDTLVSLTLAVLNDLPLSTLFLSNLGKATGQVAGSPVLELAGPFLDPENYRNIKTTVEALKRQGSGTSGNASVAKALKELEEEEARQNSAGAPPQRGR